MGFERNRPLFVLLLLCLNRNVSSFLMMKKTANGRFGTLLFSENEDPRVLKRKNGQQYREMKEELRKQKEASAAMDLPEIPLVQTLPGGENLLFEMVRQQRRWHPTITSNTATGSNDNGSPSSTTTTKNGNGASSDKPSQGGYAGTIWKNSRKRHKPAMWKYALRTFDQMPDHLITNAHFEGALVACAKLGEWTKALEIYEKVHAQEKKLRRQSSLNRPRDALASHVSESIVMSVLRACVRGSRKKDPDSTELSTGKDERRKALDAAVELLAEIEERHEMIVGTRHVNPIAAAYDKLGLYGEAAYIVNTYLENRTKGPEPENGPDQFNVNDIKAKDKGSYSLLVQGSVSEEDWGAAVAALRDMTDAGLYPSKRHLNRWTEVSEGHRRNRTTRGWKKKRDEYWIQRVQ